MLPRKAQACTLVCVKFYAPEIEHAGLPMKPKPSTLTLHFYSLTLVRQ